MAYVEGRVTVLRVDLNGEDTYTDVGGMKDCSVNFTNTMIDTTTHGTTRDKTFISGRSAGTISGSCLFDDGDAGQIILIESAHAASAPTSNLIYIEYDVGDSGSLSSYKATALVDSVTISGPNDDASTLDFSLQLSGAVTIA